MRQGKTRGAGQAVKGTCAAWVQKGGRKWGLAHRFGAVTVHVMRTHLAIVDGERSVELRGGALALHMEAM